MVTDAINGRSRILRAASDLFAQEGYDGVTVDEIAAHAGVNKALIYYYFSGKREVLETLVRNAINSVISARDVILKRIDTTSDNIRLRPLVETTLRLLEDERDAFRIMAFEALKSTDSDGALFRFLKEVSKDSVKRIENHGLTIEDPHAFDLTVFYSFVMMGMFLIFGERWSKALGYEREATEQLFADFHAHVLETLIPLSIED